MALPLLAAAATDSNVREIAQQLAWFLLGAAVIGMIARRLSMPYIIALVVGGLLIEESHVAKVPHLDPGMVLFIFLPPLLFDAAFRLDAREVRMVAVPVVLLAVPGVLVGAIVVAVVLALLTHLSFSQALLFGSLVAATDPVAVVGIFKSLHVPGRITVIAEAESLINDGMAVTLYTAVVGLTITNNISTAGIVELIGREVLGGLAIGVVMGVVFSRLATTVDDHLVEMTLSTALAYGSYLTATTLHSSGVLACVAAGFVHGSYGREIGMTSTTRERLDDLWEYLGFLANGFVFLLVGLSVDLAGLARDEWPVIVAIVAVIGSRIVLLSFPIHISSRRPVQLSFAERSVLIWSGLRGGLTIALALSLPASAPERDLLITMAFGVVLFTLLVQGLTLGSVIRATGIGHAS